MATITSAQSGDFSDTATWVGGVVPTVGDIAVAATGHVIAIDVDVTVDQVDQAGTGKFTLGNGRTLTANVLARAGTFTSGGTVEVTATSGSTAYIIGNVTAVATTAASVAGVVMTGTGNLDITGNVESSASNTTSLANRNAAVYANTSCDIEINGNVTAGQGNWKMGLLLESLYSGTVTILGDVKSQALSTSQTGGTGIYVTTNAAIINITGNISGGVVSNRPAIECVSANITINVTGNITGGTGGIFSSGIIVTGATVTVVGDLLSGTPSGPAIQQVAGTLTVTGDITTSNAIAVLSTGSISIDVAGTLTPSSSGPAIQALVNTSCIVDGAINVDAGNRWPLQVLIWSLRNSDTTVDIPTVNDGIVTYVNEASTTGMPIEADVRDGTVYGALNGLTGTLAVPPSGAVSIGVPVDDTVGVAQLDTNELATSLADSLVDILVGITENNNTITVPFNRGTETFTRAAVIDGSRTVQLIPNE
jgi:hypothetical protein